MTDPETPTTDPAGRSNLIAAVLSCMAEQGQRGTTVRAVAERAGVTLGLVKHHFGNKEGLLVETYRHLNQLALERIQKATEVHSTSFETALGETIKALFPNDFSDVRQMRVLVAFWGLVLTNPQFAQVQAQTNAQMRHLFIRLIEKHAPDMQDVGDIAEGIIALTDGLWLECCMNPNRMTPDRATKIAIQISLKNVGQ